MVRSTVTNYIDEFPTCFCKTTVWHNQTTALLFLHFIQIGIAISDQLNVKAVYFLFNIEAKDHHSPPQKIILTNKQKIIRN